jgi:hypothetical protein
MSAVEFRLRTATTASVACKICEAPSSLFGVVDMNRPCEIGGKPRPLSGVPVYYRRCESCGFLFTDAFDDWEIDEFKTHIYNDEYIVYDPDYKERRPNANGNIITRLWSDHKAGMRVLDYGGGNDVLCATLRANGFKEAVTYDPMVSEHALQPAGKFDLITCFETLEHLPNPIAAIGKMAELVADPGAVFYSTLTQPADFHQKGMAWWYIGPRNGHVSIFTRQALTAAWAKFGFKNASLNDGMHLAFRNMPETWQMAVQ